MLLNSAQRAVVGAAVSAAQGETKTREGGWHNRLYNDRRHTSRFSAFLECGKAFLAAKFLITRCQSVRQTADQSRSMEMAKDTGKNFRKRRGQEPHTGEEPEDGRLH